MPSGSNMAAILVTKGFRTSVVVLMVALVFVSCAALNPHTSDDRTEIRIIIPGDSQFPSHHVSRMNGSVTDVHATDQDFDYDDDNSTTHGDPMKRLQHNDTTMLEGPIQEDDDSDYYYESEDPENHTLSQANPTPHPSTPTPTTTSTTTTTTIATTTTTRSPSRSGAAEGRSLGSIIPDQKSRNASLDAKTNKIPSPPTESTKSSTAKMEEVNYWGGQEEQVGHHQSNPQSKQGPASEESMVSVKEHDRSPPQSFFSASGADEWFGLSGGGGGGAGWNPSKGHLSGGGGGGSTVPVIVENYQSKDASVKGSEVSSDPEETAVEIKEHDELGPGAFHSSSNDGGQWFSEGGGGGGGSVDFEDPTDTSGKGSWNLPNPAPAPAPSGGGGGGGGEDVWFGLGSSESEWSPVLVASSSHRKQRRLVWGEENNSSSISEKDHLDYEELDIITAPPPSLQSTQRGRNAKSDIFSFVVESSFGGTGSGTTSNRLQHPRPPKPAEHDDVDIITLAPQEGGGVDSEMGWFGGNPATEVPSTTSKSTVLQNPSKSTRNKGRVTTVPSREATTTLPKTTDRGHLKKTTTNPLDLGTSDGPRSSMTSSVHPTTTTKKKVVSTSTAISVTRIQISSEKSIRVDGPDPTTTTTGSITTTMAGTKAPLTTTQTPPTTTQAPPTTTETTIIPPRSGRKHDQQQQQQQPKAVDKDYDDGASPVFPQSKVTKNDSSGDDGDKGLKNRTVAAVVKDSAGSKSVIKASSSAMNRDDRTTSSATVDSSLSYVLVGTCCGIAFLCAVIAVVVIGYRRLVRQKRRTSSFLHRQHLRVASYGERVGRMGVASMSSAYFASPWPSSAETAATKSSSAALPVSQLWFSGRSNRSPYSLCDQHLDYNCITSDEFHHRRPAPPPPPPPSRSQLTMHPRPGGGGGNRTMVAPIPVPVPSIDHVYHRSAIPAPSTIRHSSGLDAMNKSEMIYWSSNNEHLI